MTTFVISGPDGTIGDVGITPFVIGRGPECDLVISDTAISQRHAQLEVQPDARVVLRDLGSTTGTFIGDRRIEGGAWLPVPGGFRVGATELRLDSVPSPATPPVSAPPGSADRRAIEGGSRTAPTVVVSSVMPAELPRALAFLGVAGAIQALGGILLLAAVAGAIPLDFEPGAETMLTAVALGNIVAGGVEVGLAALTRRRNRTAAYALLVLAVVLAAIAAWDVWTVIDQEGSIALPALRLGANLAGAIVLIQVRAWFDPKETP